MEPYQIVADKTQKSESIFLGRLRVYSIQPKFVAQTSFGSLSLRRAQAQQ